MALCFVSYTGAAKKEGSVSTVYECVPYTGLLPGAQVCAKVSCPLLIFLNRSEVRGGELSDCKLCSAEVSPALLTFGGQSGVW